MVGPAPAPSAVPRNAVSMPPVPRSTANPWRSSDEVSSATAVMFLVVQLRVGMNVTTDCNELIGSGVDARADGLVMAGRLGHGDSLMGVVQVTPTIVCETGDVGERQAPVGIDTGT